MDLLDSDRRRELGFRHPDAVQVSAADGEGLGELRAALDARFREALRPVELLLPYREGARLSELHQLAGEVEREDTPDGVRVRALLPVSAAMRFRPFAVARDRVAIDPDPDVEDGSVLAAEVEPAEAPEGELPEGGHEEDGTLPATGAGGR